MGRMRMVEKIQQLIADRDWTQEAVETWARLPRNRISKWAGGTGEPTASQALRLARLFNVPLEWLCDDAAEGQPEMGATSEEQGILDLYRALGLTKKDALRALSLAARDVEPPSELGRAPAPRRNDDRGQSRRSV